MKKILVAILVLALVAPAFAVTFSTADMTGGKLRVSYTLTAGEVLRGMALKVKVLSGNATINATTDVAFQAITPQFNTFVDYAFSVPTGYDVGVGHCLANPAAAGVLDLATPKNEFVVSVGFLDTAGAQAGLTVSSFFDVFFDLTTDSTVEVSADTLRGGIVGDALVASNLPLQQLIGGTPLEAVKSTAPFYADWVAYGKPACWAYRKACRGDINGLNQSSKAGTWAVGTDDLNILLPVWQVMGTLSPTGICADINHAAQSSKAGSWRVGTDDLNLFLPNWQIMNPGVADCDMTNYNFWTN